MMLEPELAPPLDDAETTALLNPLSIVTHTAKIFCIIVNFSFFVIGVMLSPSLFCVA
jgi:hypothetical protein